MEKGQERLVTHESDMHLSPRTKGMSKLAKHIRFNFTKFAEAPSTTAEFYRVGKMLGKGAFGKVNLAMHRLTGQMVATKSINKECLQNEN